MSRSRPLLLLWLFAFGLEPTIASAETAFTVLRILSSRQLLLSARSESDCELHSLFAIYPQEKHETEAIAFAEAEEFRAGEGCVCVVTAHPKSPLIRPADGAEKVNLRNGSEKIPGRYDLLQIGHRKFAARYKPLVYGGLLFGQTGSTLDRHETLAGLSSLMFGVSDRLQLDFTWPRLIENVGEAGAKLRFYENEDMQLALHLQGSRFFATGQGAWMGELLFDNTANARTLHHTRLRFSSKIPQQILFEDETKKELYSVEFSTVNEWMLKNWHRILFGPKFQAGEEYDLGFLFSYVFVFERLHASLNLNVNSVRNFDFAGYRQVIGADLYWRF